MRTVKDEKKAVSGLRAILSRPMPKSIGGEPASGIKAIELGADELDRVSGGRASTKLARAGTTCSPCADDCGQ